MPARKGIFSNLYKLFSLNSHPTWHSIDVIVHGFEPTDQEPENFLLMDAMIRMSAMIGAFILYDYCSLFMEARAAFYELPPDFQVIINSLLFTYKGNEYRI